MLLENDECSGNEHEALNRQIKIDNRIAIFFILQLNLLDNQLDSRNKTIFLDRDLLLYLSLIHICTVAQARPNGRCAWCARKFVPYL